MTAADRTLPTRSPESDKNSVTIVYVLYLLGFLTGGLTTLVGLIMAYVQKGQASDRAFSHYVFQIRTVWVGLAWSIIAGFLVLFGIPLTLVLIGFLMIKVGVVIFGLMGLWYAVRCILGLLAIWRGDAYPRPRAWIA